MSNHNHPRCWSMTRENKSNNCQRASHGSSGQAGSHHVGSNQEPCKASHLNHHMLELKYSRRTSLPLMTKQSSAAQSYEMVLTNVQPVPRAKRQWSVGFTLVLASRTRCGAYEQQGFQRLLTEHGHEVAHRLAIDYKAGNKKHVVAGTCLENASFSCVPTIFLKNRTRGGLGRGCCLRSSLLARTAANNKRHRYKGNPRVTTMPSYRAVAEQRAGTAQMKQRGGTVDTDAFCWGDFVAVPRNAGGCITSVEQR